MTVTLPTKCPSCSSENTVYLASVDVSVCRDCDCDFWWSEHDGEIVHNGSNGKS